MIGRDLFHVHRGSRSLLPVGPCRLGTVVCAFAAVTHFGGASSQQTCPERQPEVACRRVPEQMYLQLYRSKVQFSRKYSGEPRASRFKTYLRLAYWPRAVLSHLLAFFKPVWRPRAQTYRRLLVALSGMV